MAKAISQPVKGREGGRTFVGSESCVLRSKKGFWGGRRNCCLGTSSPVGAKSRVLIAELIAKDLLIRMDKAVYPRSMPTTSGCRTQPKLVSKPIV